MPTDIFPSTPPDAPLRRVRDRWGWFLAYGLIAALLGVVALVMVVASTIASIVLIGVLVIIAGLLEIMVGASARSWGWRTVWIAVGVLYVLGGMAAIAQPLMAAALFTLILGASFVATGVLRIVAGLQLHEGPRLPVTMAGVVTLLVGALILAGWPGSSLVVLGSFLGFDLLFYGLGWVVFALRLRKWS